MWQIRIIVDFNTDLENGSNFVIHKENMVYYCFRPLWHSVIFVAFFEGRWAIKEDYILCLVQMLLLCLVWTLRFVSLPCMGNVASRLQEPSVFLRTNNAIIVTADHLLEYISEKVAG